jgi:hypothetical protein
MTIIDMWIIWVLFGWLLFLVIHFSGDDKWIPEFLCGLYLAVMGVFALAYGIGDTNDWLTQAVGFVHIGMGLIIFLSAPFRFRKEKEEDKYHW